MIFECPFPPVQCAPRFHAYISVIHAAFCIDFDHSRLSPQFRYTMQFISATAFKHIRTFTEPAEFTPIRLSCLRSAL